MPRVGPTWALRHRLLLIAAFAMLACLAVGGYAMYRSENIEDDALLDARLEHLGSTILWFVENEPSTQERESGSTESHLSTLPAAALLYRFQVWNRDGELLMRSHEASNREPLAEFTQVGYGTARLDGGDYRTFVVRSVNGRLVVQVAESLDERIGKLLVVTAYYVAFLLLPFAVLFTATWLMLRRSLASIETIAAQLGGRNPLDTAPLRVDSPPEEMMPILTALDALFLRFGHALSIERRFTSMAAHELRTPLAGLRANSQLALTAPTLQEAGRSLMSVIRGVDRTSHLLSQLLDLARIEALAQEGRVQFEPVDIGSLYREALLDLQPLADDKGLSVSGQFEVASIMGVRFALFLVVRNLLANAMLYCPKQGVIRVATALERSEHIGFTVDDSGPGIAENNRERAFERFNRLGHSESAGVGLGLSIVLMVVELHGAKIRLIDSPVGGLRAQVLFRAP